MDFLDAGLALSSSYLGYQGQQQTNAQNLQISQANNQFNADQAQLNRNFQERMSNTQYQRATADLAAAGLNPMLAYQQGGAGTPSGSSASAAANPVMGNSTGAGIAAGFSAAQMANMREQNELLRAQVGKTKAETATELNQPENVRARTSQATASAGQLSANTDETRARLDAMIPRLDAELKKTQADWNSRQTNRSLSLQDLDADVLRSLARARNAAAALDEVHAPEVKAFGDLYRKYPWLAGVEKGLDVGSKVVGGVTGLSRAGSASRAASAAERSSRRTSSSEWSRDGGSSLSITPR